MNIRHFVLITVCFVYFTFVCSVNAIEVKELFFSDNFSGDISQNWNLFNDGGNVSTGSSGIFLSSDTRSYPFLSANKNIFPTDGNYEIHIVYSYPSTTDFGVGFGFGNYIPSYGNSSYPQPDDFIRWIYFHAWQGKNDNHVILGRNCADNTTCDQNLTFLHKSNYNDNVHNLDIKFLDDHFVLILDGSEISNPVLLNSHRRPTDFWIGNPVKLQTSNVWSNLNIKEITVYKISDIAPGKEAVFVLPGFGGSWDVGAVLRGQSGSNWKIPDFIKEYDGITNSLKNAGYVEGEDLFIFPYDWRKSLDALATDLKQFVDSKNLGDRKINLVGHSMGGLVARTYLQNYNNPNILKVITAGSPHKGIIDAYGLWEGATVWDSVWWQKVLLEIATEVNRQPDETKVQSVRRISPSVKDLMPTEDFLVQNSVSKPWNSLFWKNTYLNQKNTEVGTFLPKLFAGASDDYPNTRSKINVENPSLQDNLRGMWVDGKPKQSNPFLFSPGDGYVNLNSAQKLFDKKIDLSGGHGETISKLENIQKILTELNIATESAVGSPSDTRKSVFVAKLNSPGVLHVCLLNQCDANLGLVFAEEKLIIVPGYNNEKYSLAVEAQGETGSYELLVGEINNSGVWKNIDGKLNTASQVDSYFYDGTTEQLSADNKTVENMLKVYWPKKLRLNDIYELRQKILGEIDKNIKSGSFVDFDTNISKWRTLDYFVASEHARDRSFWHNGWDTGRKKIKKSKYFVKTNNYFSASLVSLLSEKEVEYKATPYWQIKLKVDKLVQIYMLRSFMGL